jgi:hypothetical protein
VQICRLEEGMRQEISMKDQAMEELRAELAKAQEAVKSAEHDKHMLTLELNTVQHKHKMDEVEARREPD